MNRKTCAALTLAAFVASAHSALATLYCERTYSELTRDPGKPYNAVGFLNNGCTAFLIDKVTSSPRRTAS